MKPNLLKNLRARLNVLPGCQDYADLLDYAHIVTGMNYNGLRKSMGLATYARWAHFLNI